MPTQILSAFLLHVLMMASDAALNAVTAPAKTPAADPKAKLLAAIRAEHQSDPTAVRRLLQDVPELD